jgi:hypothetical protein
MNRLLPYRLIGSLCRIGALIVLIINVIQLVIGIFTGFVSFDDMNKLDKMGDPSNPLSPVKMLSNFSLYLINPFLSTILTIILQVSILYVISMVADYVAARQANPYGGGLPVPPTEPSHLG